VIHNHWNTAGSELPNGLPDPLRAIAPYLTIGLLAALLGAAGVIRTLDWEALVAASAFAGSAALGSTWLRREHVRVAADAWIAHHAGSAPAASVLDQRAATLTGARHRAMVAGSLRRVVSEAGSPSYRRSARVPVDAVAVRHCEPQLLRLAGLLADPRTPVTPRAVVLAEELITDPGSPVYRHTTQLGCSLGERLRQTLFELERSL
jgi:hypothetical protein